MIPKDLIEFGLIPEFVGRLPVVASLETLDVDDLVRVLQEPKNALVRQFQTIFELQGKQLEFTPEGLRTIAQTAIERETGVRALRSILEEMLLDLLYELPARKDTETFTVDEDVVLGRKPLARGLTADPAEGTQDGSSVADGPSDDPELPETDRESA
jgi:ATP-dependent Clp protease ATP-binding subunit ClpX